MRPQRLDVAIEGAGIARERLGEADRQVQAGMADPERPVRRIPPVSIGSAEVAATCLPGRNRSGSVTFAGMG
jgi:hypothetical protein